MTGTIAYTDFHQEFPPDFTVFANTIINNIILHRATIVKTRATSKLQR